MRKVLILALLLVIASPVFSAQRVKGYYKSNGTYVKPYYKTSPDNRTYNNYSAKGNYNPYTGKTGTRNYNSYSAKSYGYKYRY